MIVPIVSSLIESERDIFQVTRYRLMLFIKPHPKKIIKAESRPVSILVEDLVADAESLR